MNGNTKKHVDVTVNEETAPHRAIVNFISRTVAVMAVCLSLFQLYTAGFGAMTAIVQRAIHLGAILVLAFLIYPVRHGTRKDKVNAWTLIDLLLAAAAIVCSFYVVYYLDDIFDRQGDWTRDDVIIGLIGIFLVLEACRRVVGWFMTIICAMFLAYAWLGPYVPEMFAHKGYGVERIATTMFMTTEGVFGIPVGVAATFVFVFVLFGAFLEASGGGNFFIDLAYALTGRFSGGPAKTSVIASGFMGSVSGSAIANVVATGSFTIPMMKKVGFRPHVAGAIEAAASTGGQLMPPIMGAGAFLMAEFTNTSYLTIIKVALIPAILYYFTVLLFVHFEAKKKGLTGAPKDQLPKIRNVLAEGYHFIVPVVILVAALLSNVSPMMAGFIAVMSTYMAAALRKKTRMGPVLPVFCGAGALGISFLFDSYLAAYGNIKWMLAGVIVVIIVLMAFVLFRNTIIPRFAVVMASLVFAAAFILNMSPVDSAVWVTAGAFISYLFYQEGRQDLKPLGVALERGARNAVMVSVACAAAGIIVGIISLTGQGLNFSSLVLRLSMGIEVFAILLIGFASLVLGMGLPVTASYIVLATLAGPALMSMGVPVLIAHMIVFWYSQDANVTPPVSLASFAGAGVAGANPMRTAFTSWKLAKGLYIIPIVMAYRPLLLNGPWWEVILAIVSCAAGLLAFAAALDRYLLRTATWLEFAFLLVSSICFFLPDLSVGSMVIPACASDIAGLILLITTVLLQRKK